MRCPSAWRSRSRASSSSTGWRSSAASRRASWKRPAARPTGAAPKIRFKPDPDIFGAKAAFQAERVFKMARSKAYLYGGVEIRWRCAKELLKGVEDVPEKATFHFAEGLKDYLAASLSGATLVHPRHLHRLGRQDRPPRRGRMGGGLDRRCGRLPAVLLQHHPDAGRRHARIRPAHRAAARPERSRRPRRPGKARQGRDQRRRDDRRRLHALGVRARAGIPGPDQGPPRHCRRAEDRRTGDQGPVRPLAVGQPAAGQQAPGFRHRARRGTPAPPPGKGHRPQDRGEEAPPARQARRLLELGLGRLGDFHRRGRLGRRLGQAGARPPLAGGAALARQDFERRFRRQGQAGAERPARRSDPGARLRHRRALPRQGSALREGHHHDRRRRRRRAHRFAA